MARQNWKGSVLIAPVPPTMVTSAHDGKQNVFTVAWTGVLNTQPPKELLELAEKAKFSHHTLKAEELQPFGLYRREAVEQLKKRNLFLQIYYRLILAKY